MAFNRLLAEDERRRDVAVGLAQRRQAEDLYLAPGQISRGAPCQARPIASLKTVPVPPNLGDFLTDPTTGSPSMVAATQLGKALFWDMQVGSDGIQACASCHFSSGADDRTINQVSPGLLATPPDTTFQIGGPNVTLTASDFPLHQLVDPNSAQSAIIRDTNDIVGSQGSCDVTLSTSSARCPTPVLAYPIWTGSASRV
jgi:Di-haem cytochrome c peroxidase